MYACQGRLTQMKREFCNLFVFFGLFSVQPGDFSENRHTTSSSTFKKKAKDGPCLSVGLSVSLSLPWMTLGIDVVSPSSQSLVVKEFCFMARGICRGFFREISCAHFSWKLKDEIWRKISPNFRRVFRPCRRNCSPQFRSRGFSA